MSYASCVYRAFREGSGKSDGYADFGTRYLYVGFQNSDRLNTGYICRDGSFQQTYPTKQKFYSLQAWKNAVTGENPTAFFLGEEEWHYEHVLSGGQWSQIYKQKLETKMREYARRIAQRPTAEPPAPTPPPASEPVEEQPLANEPLATVESFTCPACGLGSGADHRMCICRSYNYSPTEWEIACRLRPATREVQPIRVPVVATEATQASTQNKYIVKLKISKKDFDVKFRHTCTTLEESSRCLRNFVKAWHLLHNKEDTLSDNVAFSASNLKVITKNAPLSKSLLLTTKEEPFRLYITPMHS